MPVKEELSAAEESEINDLAYKIAQANKQKIAHAQIQVQQALNGPVAPVRWVTVLQSICCKTPSLTQVM